MKSQSGSNKIKLMIYALHPIMYQTPIFSELNNFKKFKLPWLDFKVYFGSNLSMKKTYFSSFKSKIKNDYDNLLEGYDYEFLKNYTFDEREGFFSRINFGIIPKILLGKYDVILLHGYSTVTSLIILLFSIFARKKIIFRGESILNNNEIFPLLKKIYLKIFFHFCHKILYSCYGNKCFFIHYGVPLSKLTYIPCAVNNKFFQDKIRKLNPLKNKIKVSIGIKDKDLVLSMCCSFIKRKRVMDLIKAAKNLESKKNIFLLFIGDGPEKSLIKSSLKNSGIRHYITGFVAQNDISKYYLVSNISLVLSDYDPSPKALNEAMNFSNCVIGTLNVGTSVDLIKNNLNGYIIKTADIENLTKILGNLQKNRPKVIKMGKESLKIVSKFNYQTNVKAIVQILENIRNEFSKDI